MNQIRLAEKMVQNLNAILLPDYIVVQLMAHLCNVRPNFQQCLETRTLYPISHMTKVHLKTKQVK